MATEDNCIHKNMVCTNVASEEEHFNLKHGPGGYLEICLKEESYNLELQVEKEPQLQEGSTWTRKSILLLLACLSKRKQDLRNSKIKKKDIWRQIKEEMVKNGYTCYDENNIERKFRNMKNTHKTIKENKKRSSTGQVKWEYFEAMEEIFIDDKTVNIGHTISSLPSTSNTESSLIKTVPLPSPFHNFINHIENEEQCKRKEIGTLETSIAVSTPSRTTPSTVFSPSLGGSSSNKFKGQRARQLYGLRKRQLEIEESRIKELQMLREALEESNRIQKERNELFKLFLEQ